jgi:Mn-dependent DtxR family transcriptional regulator
VPRDKLTIRERILILLAKKSCLTLDELARHLKVDKNVLKVYLSRLAKEGIITRRWRHIRIEINGEEREFVRREYCMRTSVKEELGIE